MTTITLTNLQARRFLLSYHGLYGEFDFIGMEGIMSYIRRVGCIQFDPLNVVGMNPELVLQSRIKNFKRDMLSGLLYKERKLVDYWDKNLSIFPLEDWPYFNRYRKSFQPWCSTNKEAVKRVHTDITNQGFLCSGDLQYDEKVSWAWGPTRLSRAALEGMYHAGHLVIHHKQNTRKYYDLTERLIPEELHSAPDPFMTDQQYYEWYVLRRIGSVGLLWNRPSDAWLGIKGLKKMQRNDAFDNLLNEKKITEVQVEGLKHPLYIRSADMELLNKSLSAHSTNGPATNKPSSNERSSILAPLDNLLWDRKLIQQLFDFEYRWEVYKPAAERKYGYYVLPVICGDKIVARFDPEKHRKNGPLVIKNWWWEDDVSVTEPMKESIAECLERFALYLGASFNVEDYDWLK